MGTTELRDDRWHHVRGTWDGSHIRLYIDGVLEEGGTLAYPPASTLQSLSIGERLSGWGGYMPFRGVIDDVIISRLDAPPLPGAFHLGSGETWPKSGLEPFSHPGQMIWEAYATNVPAQFVGWDYDPRTNAYEACFEFEYVLPAYQWYTQEVGQTNVFWLSIAAVYGPEPSVHVWDGKPGRAAAHRSHRMTPSAFRCRPGRPRECLCAGCSALLAAAGQLLDLAFELRSERFGGGHVPMEKWTQTPDLLPSGLNVDATAADPWWSRSSVTFWRMTSNARPRSTGRDYDLGRLVPDPPPEFFDPALVRFCWPSARHSGAQSPTGYSMPGADFGAYVRAWLVPGNIRQLTSFQGCCCRRSFIIHKRNRTITSTSFLSRRPRRSTSRAPRPAVTYWLRLQAIPISIGEMEPLWFGWKSS